MRFSVPNVNLEQASLRVLLDVDIDGKMCVDISHLVFETPSDADYEVVDEGLDCSKSGDVLPSTMMQLDVHNVFRRMGEADS